MNHSQVSVIGSGTMGNGIAHVFAQSGRQVTLIDVNQELLDRALTKVGKNLERQKAKGRLDEEPEAILARITTATDVSAVAGSTIAIEAVPEDRDLKRSVFEKLDGAMPDGAVLASNTSSISITTILRFRLATAWRMLLYFSLVGSSLSGHC